MKPNPYFSEFSFLTISPLPGSTSLRYCSIFLVALAVCEVVSVLMDAGSWALLLWVVCVGIGICWIAYTAFQVCSRHESSQVGRLSTLAQVCIALKLVMLCFVLSVVVHRAVHECADIVGMESCEKLEYWWEMNSWTLVYEGFLTVSSVLLLVLLLSKARKMALELRYRSITHYLAL